MPHKLFESLETLLLYVFCRLDLNLEILVLLVNQCKVWLNFDVLLIGFGIHFVDSSDW
jgi:uncharacterized paraquat-inducible protein A